MLRRLPTAAPRTARAWLAAAVLVVSIGSTAPAGAQSADSNPRALELFNQGRELLLNKQPSAALSKLEESLGLLPSPNTQLLIAHANRELGERVVALQTYEAVQRSAAAEVARGQARYQATKEEAERWIGELQKVLARVEVNAPGDAVSVSLPKVRAVVRVTGKKVVWSEPGEVRAVLERQPDGLVIARVAAAGDTVTLDFAAAPGANARAADSDASSGPVVSAAGIVLLGVGAAGMGLFAGFGISSKSAGDTIDDQCPERTDCSPGLADTIDAGERDQLIANISLGVGLASLAAGATVWIVEAATASPAKTGGRKLPAVALVVPTTDGAGMLALIAGRF